MSVLPGMEGPVAEILIVEDSRTQAEQLRHLLDKSGYEVTVALDGDRALAAARQRAPGLVISDVVMPGMDGYELCGLIKADPGLKNVPVILLTSLADPHDVVRGLQAGADNFLTKPYDDEYLLARVQSILANQELRRRGKAEMKLEILFGGQMYSISSERQQILDLLLSTYETAVQKNRELIEAQKELRLLNEQLEERVHDRTQALTVEIGERRRAEEEVRRLNAELEQRVVRRTAQLEAANNELEAFSYSVSHDLRAPLRTIDGFSQALQEDVAGSLDETNRDHLQRIRQATQRMDRLIDDLLTLSRVARSDMRRETVDLSELARSIAAELRNSEAERNVEFAIADDVAAEGDPALLRVALSNLIGNAWKFTSRQPTAHIEFSAAEHDGAREYFVRDNGAGFDMAHAGKLFGAFQRLHTASEFPGTGIGLATVQRIVHRHGGQVRAEGEMGQGATFYFTLL